MVLLVVSSVVGSIRVFAFGADPLAAGVNLAWSVFDLIVLSVLFKAVAYTGHTADPATPTEENQQA